MAPEIIVMEKKKGEIREDEMKKADIWGFGKLCLQPTVNILAKIL